MSKLPTRSEMIEKLTKWAYVGGCTCRPGSFECKRCVSQAEDRYNALNIDELFKEIERLSPREPQKCERCGNYLHERDGHWCVKDGTVVWG